MTDTMTFGSSYEKLRVSTRHWMLGRGYYMALKAMEFAGQYHTGTRRDGSPEFSHQVWQAHYVRTLSSNLLYPEETLATVFLHDVVEDYGVRLDEIHSRFGSLVTPSVDRMSKEVHGAKKSDEVYFAELALDPISSVAKGVDRIHNHQSMPGAMSDAKQLSYMAETDDGIMPMLRAARRRFPEQDLAYENIKHTLVVQMEIFRSKL